MALTSSIYGRKSYNENNSDPPPSKDFSNKPIIIDLYGELATREDHGYAVGN
mgnify:FL=1